MQEKTLESGSPTFLTKKKREDKNRISTEVI